MCAARAYSLYLLGYTLFTDKSAIRVLIIYLTFLMDLNIVHSYAWGAAASAYLYSQLGLASRYGVCQIAGYLMLLEARVYEHFEDIIPNPNLQYYESQPQVHSWIPRRESGEAMSTLQTLREKIDMMSTDRVIIYVVIILTVFILCQLTWYTCFHVFRLLGIHIIVLGTTIHFMRLPFIVGA